MVHFVSIGTTSSKKMYTIANLTLPQSPHQRQRVSNQYSLSCKFELLWKVKWIQIRDILLQTSNWWDTCRGFYCNLLACPRICVAKEQSNNAGQFSVLFMRCVVIVQGWTLTSLFLLIRKKVGLTVRLLINIVLILSDYLCRLGHLRGEKRKGIFPSQLSSVHFGVDVST